MAWNVIPCPSFISFWYSKINQTDVSVYFILSSTVLHQMQRFIIWYFYKENSTEKNF